MSEKETPFNQFDLQAGAKAAYEEYGNRLHVRYQSWATLRASDQYIWVQVIKAGIREAQETRKRKVTGRLLRLLPAQRAAPIGRLVSTTRRYRGYPATDKGGTQ